MQWIIKALASILKRPLKAIKPLQLGGQDMKRLINHENQQNQAAEYKVCPCSLNKTCFDLGFGLYTKKAAKGHHAFITGWCPYTSEQDMQRLFSHKIRQQNTKFALAHEI